MAVLINHWPLNYDTDLDNIILILGGYTIPPNLTQNSKQHWVKVQAKIDELVGYGVIEANWNNLSDSKKTAALKAFAHLWSFYFKQNQDWLASQGISASQGQTSISYQFTQYPEWIPRVVNSYLIATGLYSENVGTDTRDLVFNDNSQSSFYNSYVDGANASPITGMNAYATFLQPKGVESADRSITATIKKGGNVLWPTVDLAVNWSAIPDRVLSPFIDTAYFNQNGNRWRPTKLYTASGDITATTLATLISNTVAKADFGVGSNLLTITRGGVGTNTISYDLSSATKNNIASSHTKATANETAITNLTSEVRSNYIKDTKFTAGSGISVSRSGSGVNQTLTITNTRLGGSGSGVSIDDDTIKQNSSSQLIANIDAGTFLSSTYQPYAGLLPLTGSTPASRNGRYAPIAIFGTTNRTVGGVTTWYADPNLTYTASQIRQIATSVAAITNNYLVKANLRTGSELNLVKAGSNASETITLSVNDDNDTVGTNSSGELEAKILKAGFVKINSRYAPTRIYKSDGTYKSESDIATAITQTATNKTAIASLTTKVNALPTSDTKHSLDNDTIKLDNTGDIYTTIDKPYFAKINSLYRPTKLYNASGDITSGALRTAIANITALQTDYVKQTGLKAATGLSLTTSGTGAAKTFTYSIDFSKFATHDRMTSSNNWLSLGHGLATGGYRTLSFTITPQIGDSLKQSGSNKTISVNLNGNQGLLRLPGFVAGTGISLTKSIDTTTGENKIEFASTSQATFDDKTIKAISSSDSKLEVKGLKKTDGSLATSASILKDISDNKTARTANTTNIATNTSGIATNTTAIATNTSGLANTVAKANFRAASALTVAASSSGTNTITYDLSSATKTRLRRIATNRTNIATLTSNALTSSSLVAGSNITLTSAGSGSSERITIAGTGGGGTKPIDAVSSDFAYTSSTKTLALASGTQTAITQALRIDKMVWNNPIKLNVSTTPGVARPYTVHFAYDTTTLEELSVASSNMGVVGVRYGRNKIDNISGDNIAQAFYGKDPLSQASFTQQVGNNTTLTIPTALRTKLQDRTKKRLWVWRIKVARGSDTYKYRIKLYSEDMEEQAHVVIPVAAVIPGIAWANTNFEVIIPASGAYTFKIISPNSWNSQFTFYIDEYYPDITT